MLESEQSETQQIRDCGNGYGRTPAVFPPAPFSLDTSNCVRQFFLHFIKKSVDI